MDLPNCLDNCYSEEKEWNSAGYCIENIKKSSSFGDGRKFAAWPSALTFSGENEATEVMKRPIAGTSERLEPASAAFSKMAA